jgi:hypothetical protein
MLQETWEVKFPANFHLPGFQTLLARTRVGMRGGGVGFFVREGLNFKERTNLDLHTEKTFENLVLEVSFPNKTVIISNIYRSPTPPRGIPTAQHMEGFLSTLDAHLALLLELDKPVYVFLDANINLLNIENNPLCTQYLDNIITNGFLQIISKATRIQNDKASLIDHVLTNTNMQQYQAGTLINDISDHLMNYTYIPCTVPKRNNNRTSKPVKKRLVNELNIANLKAALLHTDWASVTRETDINRSFDHFWNIFKHLYDTHCPIKTVKLNKNKHKINDYMTDELITARDNKLTLYKTYINTRSLTDANNYKIARNHYNTMLRQSKKHYYENNLALNIKNPKRTWDLLKEATNLNRSTSKIDKIVNNNNETLTEPSRYS